MFLGRIHWIKGLDFLAEGFAKAAETRDDMVLVIVGNDDGYKPALEKLVDGLGIRNKVLFAGFLAGDDKLAALVDADAVVQTSRYEQGAWAPFEAVLCETPIIVSDNSGAGEDARRIDAGYLVEFGDRHELARLIAKTIDDPAEARAKAVKAAAHIRKNMSLASRIADYEELYTRVRAQK